MGAENKTDVANKRISEKPILRQMNFILSMSLIEAKLLNVLVSKAGIKPPQKKESFPPF